MKAKRLIALLLSVLFVVALFAGCGGNNNSGNSGNSGSGAANSGSASSGTNSGSGTASGSTDTGDAGSTGDTGSGEEGPYYFAHDYAVNEDGYPVEKWVYHQPICDTDEVLTRWTSCYTPQYLPEDGFNGIITWQMVEEYTGVHIEYDIVDSAQRQANLAVLMASDDLDDILDQAWFCYSGTYDQALDEGYFADLYPYKHLMPCYMWEVYNRSLHNPDILNSTFYRKEHLVTLSGLVMTPVPTMGYYLRQDWLDDMGMGSSRDVKTFDQLHDVLLAMKSQYSNQNGNTEIYPYMIYNIGETTPGYAYGGYNTVLYTSALSYVRVVDGEVQFCSTTEDDRDLMTMISTWYNEGLISPNFQSFVAGDDFDDGHRHDACGCMPNTPGSIETDEGLDPDPDCRWEPIPRTKKVEGQIIEYGNKLGEGHYGSCNVSGSCENLELCVSYLDWWMSDFGGEFTSWGPEGWMWNYNENGEKELEEWILNHEAGMMWAMIMFANNNLMEFCLHDIKRSYCYPGGTRTWDMYSVWIMDDYGGHYDWPSGITFDADQTDEANSIRGDLETFFSENYVLFITGEKPMSAWDQYIADINQFGYARLREIYQEAYDAYMLENA